jgi:glycogen debranching enzyme
VKPARDVEATAPVPAPIVVPRDVCRDLARSSRLEWLETNGRGGFAMGTVSGASTRRYHGHLVAALRPPRQRGEPEAARAWARRVREAFERAFWDARRGTVLDVVRPEGSDRRLRPNGILAVSLSHAPLSRERRRAVVAAAEAKLLTPFGLRTLAPREDGYRPEYRGGPLERDGAYHQGAVWPWLLGPFARARLRAFGRTPENVARCRALVDGVARHLEDACLGQVSEILEAEPPFRPVGAPAQAWSVARALELLTSDLAPRRALRADLAPRKERSR